MRPRQKQPRQPGLEEKMSPRPEAWIKTPPREPKLAGRVAVISGGDSGIGRAVALAFASEGADVAILYLNEHRDAKETVRAVENAGRRAFALAGDIGSESFCRRAIARVVKQLGRLDIVVNNAAEQHPQDSIEKITAKQLERTFRTNIFSFFFLTKAALPHLKKGSAIINTTSVTAYRGSASLIDYSSTKGAIVSFTRSLAHSAGEARHSRECRRAGADLDAADSRDFSRREGRDIRLRRAAGPHRPAERSRTLLRLSRQRRFVLHDRSGAASQWRRDRQRLRRRRILSRRRSPRKHATPVCATYQIPSRDFGDGSADSSSSISDRMGAR